MTPRPPLPASLAPCILALAGSALAGEREITTTIGNQLEFYHDTALEESLLDDRLDASATYEIYSVGAVFLSHTPTARGNLDPNSFGAGQQGVRKRWIEAAAGDWNVRLGDVYATLGRGTALQIIEDPIVDYDNALDGFYGDAHRGPVTLRVIGGADTFDPYYQIQAGELAVRLPRGFEAAALGVWADSLHAPADTRFQPFRPARLAGVHMGGAIGSFGDVYGEYIRRGYDSRRGDANPPTGHGGYWSANLYAGRLQLTGEYKDLLRMDLPFSTPPTAVRAHSSTLLNRGGHTPNIRKSDERGGMAEAIVTLSDHTRLTGNWSKSEARRSYQPAWELYGEIEQWLGPRTQVVLKTAETEEHKIEGSETLFTERLTWALNLLHPLNDVWSFEMNAETQGIQELILEERDYHGPARWRDTLAALTVSRAPGMTLSVTSEWSDDPKELKDRWTWGEMNLKVGARHQLVVGGGTVRGGQLCSGGVCKLVDPFEGGRVEFITTF